MQTGYDYKAGDVYPKSGDAEVDRIKQLMTPTPQRGALIEEVAEIIAEKKKAKKSEKTEKEG